MKISVDWLKDFAELPSDIEAKELSERITLSVCEVEDVIQTGEMFSKVSAALIKEVRPHPDADNLKIAVAEIQTGKETVVVCGAPNCTAGIKVPYAPPGTVFPTGMKIEKRSIRGVLSEGMLCSEAEIEFSDNSEELMILSDEVPVGTKLNLILGETAANDILLDIDNKSLTHRPDCWGHYGLARDVSAALDVPFKDPFNQEWTDNLKSLVSKAGGEAPVRIQVAKDSSNLGFLGLAVHGVKVEKSPLWIRKRIAAVGMRPINSIVDISNYVMLETGIPNHIFDLSTVRGGKIIVRRAGEESRFVTLDGESRMLQPEDTLVCDAEGPSAIAGIMGGLSSSVSDATDGVLIEVANWVDSEIRRTSSRLGLRTDASQRYEKSLDSRQLEKTLLRILELILQLNPGAKPTGGIQTANFQSAPDVSLETGPERIASVLGRKIDEAQMSGILRSLGFTVERLSGKKDGRTHRIGVPSWRATKDIECEADIVEEIGRICGYSTIAPLSPSHDINPLRLSPAGALLRKTQDFLVLRGRALEIMTYPLTGEALLKKACWPNLNEKLVLVNALTKEHDRMRPSLIPSLINAVAENNKEHRAFRLFECGRSYEPSAGGEFSKDRHQAGIVFHHHKSNPFTDLADLVEELCAELEMNAEILPFNPAKNHPLVPGNWKGAHPHEFLEIRIDGEPGGVVFSLHPQIGQSFRIKGRTAMAVLEISGGEKAEQMVRKHSVRFRPLDRFPGADFDLTVVIGDKTYAETVVSVVRNINSPQIRSVGVLDTFALEGGKRALTLRVSFRDAEKTLDAETIRTIETAVINALEKAGYPLRS